MGAHDVNNPVGQIKKVEAVPFLRWPSFVPIALLTLFLQLSPAAGQERPAPPSPGLCYAFLRNGDVWTVCNGQREHIRLHGRAMDFAVSADGSQFIAVWEKAVAYPKDIRPPGEMLLVSLTGAVSSKMKDWPFDNQNPGPLYASCGTIIAIIKDPALQGRLGLTYDLTSGKVLSTPPYKSLRCSSDRRVMAGSNNAEDPVLIVNSPKEHTLTADEFPESFDVSPSGQYIAYFRRTDRSSQEICIVKRADEPICVSEETPSYLVGRVSVSDSGDVVYEGAAEAHCYFHDSGHYSQKPLRGYALEDPCPAVLYWHPGHGSPTTIESLGGNPQWITPEVAAALRSWNSQRAHEREKRP